MPKIINPVHFKPALDFNDANDARIAAICAPLQEHFGLSAFGYWRLFEDGRYILVSNNRLWRETLALYDYCFRTKHFSDVTNSLCKYTLNKSLWPNHNEDDGIDYLRTQGLHDGVYLVREKDRTAECYFFASDKDHPQSTQFFQDHSSVLADFTKYFHKVAGDLCDPTDPSKFGISPHCQKYYPNVDRVFMASTPWGRNIREFNTSLDVLVQNEIGSIGLRYGLTKRELECLSYLTTGKTAKEISRILMAAPRTIETHIHNIRLKTGCQNKRDLTNWFRETFKFFLDQG